MLLLRKLILSTVLSVAVVTSSLVNAEEYTLKVAHGAPTNYHMHKAWVKFKEIVENESNGEIKVNIFPSGQLGEDRELLEYIQMGEIDMNASTVAVLSAWDGAFAASELPYMFKNREIALNTLNGDYGEFIFSRLDSIGMKGMGWFENGFREMTNNKRPITKPEDMKGLKIRTMQVDAHIEAFKALGANPTPMAFGEIYSALQQKVVDGQENPLSHIVANRFYEVAPYISMTNHVYSTHIVVMNPDKFNSLPAKYQELVSRAVKEAEVYQQEIIKEEEAKNIALLEEKGAKINYLSSEEMQVFQDELKSIEPKLKNIVGEEAYNALKSSIEKESEKL